MAAETHPPGYFCIFLCFQSPTVQKQHAAPSHNQANSGKPAAGVGVRNTHAHAHFPSRHRIPSQEGITIQTLYSNDNADHAGVHAHVPSAYANSHTIVVRSGAKLHAFAVNIIYIQIYVRVRTFKRRETMHNYYTLSSIIFIVLPK